KLQLLQQGRDTRRSDRIVLSVRHKHADCARARPAARAAGGHASATPPTSLMNLRRFIGSPRGRPGAPVEVGAVGACDRKDSTSLRWATAALRTSVRPMMASVNRVGSWPSRVCSRTTNNQNFSILLCPSAHAWGAEPTLSLHSTGAARLAAGLMNAAM